MNQRMKTFLGELADLLERHNVNLNIREIRGAYHSTADGIDIDMEGYYNDGEVIRDGGSWNEGCLTEAGLYIDCDNLRELIERSIHNQKEKRNGQI